LVAALRAYAILVADTLKAPTRIAGGYVRSKNRLISVDARSWRSNKSVQKDLPTRPLTCQAANWECTARTRVNSPKSSQASVTTRVRVVWIRSVAYGPQP